MTQIAGFPYVQVEFTKEGEIFDEGQVDNLATVITDEQITDLVFFSHGWKNDIDDATKLYAELITNIRSVLDAGSADGLSDRKLGFVGVFWPSKKFTSIELQPGGGASLDGAITNSLLEKELESLKGLSDINNVSQLIEQAKLLLVDLEDKRSAQDQFVNVIRQILADDLDDEEVENEVPSNLESMRGREVLDQLSRPSMSELGSGIGGAASFGNFFGGLKGGVMNFLNMTTYWKMKKRAGNVGERGLYKTLKKIKGQFFELRLHLVGHSFGGRLVTATAKGSGEAPPVLINTLSLLQAAFSHNGFAENFDDERDGYYRSVITQKNVLGPILITHTKNDKAVGLAYPIASRLHHQDAQALVGDKNDRYGGMGRNGAQHTPEVENLELLGETESYNLKAGKVYNLHSDTFISDHGDVRNRAVANMIVSGIATT